MRLLSVNPVSVDVSVLMRDGWRQTKPHVCNILSHVLCLRLLVFMCVHVGVYVSVSEI